MGPLIDQVFSPDSTILGRAIAILVIGAIAVFMFMLNSAHKSRPGTPERAREEAERERRAQGIVTTARRELEEQRKADLQRDRTS